MRVMCRIIKRMPQTHDRFGSTSDFQARNIEQIIQLEEKENQSLTASDRVANRITDFSGSMLYVVLHVIIFVGWIVLNSGYIVAEPIDPFPFNFLTMCVSLEAIFLASFVLISQNRQAMQSDKRAKLDLQVNMLAEEENTKIITMLADIQKHLGIQKEEDKDLQQMQDDISVNMLSDFLDEAERSRGK